MALDNIESSISSSLTILAIAMWAVIMATFFAALHIPQDEITQTQILSQAVSMDNEGQYKDPASGNHYLLHYGFDNSSNNDYAGSVGVAFTDTMVVPSIITTGGPNYYTSSNTHYILRTIPIIVNGSGDMRFQSWTVQGGYDNFTLPAPQN